MTLTDYSISAFTLLNAARAVAYVPQLMCIRRDAGGAKAVSIATWSLFAAANVATVSYALVVTSDTILAVVFSLNAVGCIAIAVLTVWKRLQRMPVTEKPVSSDPMIVRIARSVDARTGQKLVQPYDIIWTHDRSSVAERLH